MEGARRVKPFTTKKKSEKKRNFGKFTIKAKETEEGFTFILHPFFFAFGLFYAFTGRIATFLIGTVSALLHEAGHAFAAERYGFFLNKLTLMPYGAAVQGEFCGIAKREEIFIAAAGPTLSLFLALFTAGLWWFFPDTYPVTEEVFRVNLSLFLVNLLPVKPLDGGRIASAALSYGVGKRQAEKAVKIGGALIAAALTAAFILLAVRGEYNWSLLFFTLFIAAGLAEDKKKGGYVRRLSVSEAALDRGVPVKEYAVSIRAPVKKLFRFFSDSAAVRIWVTDGGKVKKILFLDELSELLKSSFPGEKIGDAIKRTALSPRANEKAGEEIGPERKARTI